MNRNVNVKHPKGASSKIGPNQHARLDVHYREALHHLRAMERIIEETCPKSYETLQRLNNVRKKFETTIRRALLTSAESHFTDPFTLYRNDK
jgi:hypothetical protein